MTHDIQATQTHATRRDTAEAGRGQMRTRVPSTMDAPPNFSVFSNCMTLIHDDCVAAMAKMDACSVDAVVCDPPYGLKFMGKRWDYDVPALDVWRECLMVLKPGGHLLAFAGTRTQHRMACRIEDAGFEIRDMIAWVYGSGFPKSLDVSKAIDKAAGAKREVIGSYKRGMAMHPGNEGVDTWRDNYTGEVAITSPATDAARQWAGWGTALKPSHEIVTIATKPLDILGHCSILIANLTERIASCRRSASIAEKSSPRFQADLKEGTTNTVPASVATTTEEVPANGTETGRAGDTNSEADMLASISEEESFALNTLLSWRRTLEGVSDAAKMSTTSTVFETITDWKILSFCLSQITPADIIAAKFNPSGLNANVLRAVEYLNASLVCCSNILALSALAPAMSQEVETCRGVGAQPNLDPCIMARKPLVGTVAENVLAHGCGGLNVDGCKVGTETIPTIHTKKMDGAGVGWHPIATGERTHHTGRWPANFIHDGSEEVVGLFPSNVKGGTWNHTAGARHFNNDGNPTGYQTSGSDASTGSAARFFYCAKASKADRGEGNVHPTVKPTDLMRYLCRLVTPPGGIVLDPFMGSGSTGKAAILEGFRFIGIERDAEYIEIARARIDMAVKENDEARDDQQGLLPI